MALEVGQQAPSFSLLNQHGQTVTSDSLAGHPYVLYFYPKDNTPGCTVQAKDYSAALEHFTRLGYRVFGVSRDSVKSHQNFCTKQELTIELLSDPDEVLCRAYDVIREKNMYGKKVMGVLRSSFAVDGQGKLTIVQYNVKAKDNVQQMLSLLGSPA